MRGGYITDRRCPGNPEHGNVVGMRTGGHFCPHASHSASRPPTQSFWTDDEFEAAKSLPTHTAANQGNVKIKIEKPKRRATQKARRKR